MSKEINEELLKEMITAFSNSFDKYEFYEEFLFNGEEIMNSVFRDFISSTEGSSCCADKSGFITRRIKRAIKERKNLPLIETYQEYKNNGGDLGGINESNTDLNQICYWCPKNIKDTDSAIDLYFNLLNVPSYVERQVKQKDQQIHDLQEQLKNSITPKFSLKQKVWFILRNGKDRDVFSGTITLITLSSYYKPPKLVYTILLVDNDINLAEDELFATREEAQKRLAELEGKWKSIIS